MGIAPALSVIDLGHLIVMVAHVLMPCSMKRTTNSIFEKKKIQNL